jgi:nitrous oxide reductase
MTEQTPQPEVLGGGEEPKGPPVPEVSEPSAQAQPSGQQVDVDAIANKVAEKLRPDFEQLADRRVQGLFDKRAYQWETMAKYLQEAGGDPKKAAKAMALDQVAERELATMGSEAAVRGGTKAEDRNVSWAQFLNDLKDESGVSFSETELNAIYEGKKYPSLDDAKRDVRKAAFKKAKQATVSPGAVAPEGGGAAPVSADAEKLTNELTGLIAKGAPAKDIEATAAKLKEALAGK